MICFPFFLQSFVFQQCKNISTCPRQQLGRWVSPGCCSLCQHRCLSQGWKLGGGEGSGHWHGLWIPTKQVCYIYNGGLFIFGIFVSAGFGIIFGVPGSMLSCFSACLLLCLSVSLLYLLLFFSASLLSLLLCFLLLCCYLLLFFSASLLSLLLCFSAFVLLCLSTSTILLFLFFSHVFLLLYFLLLCCSASCLYCLFVFFFSFALFSPVCKHPR